MTQGAIRAVSLDEPRAVRALLVGAAIAFLFAFLLAPLAIVFVKALSAGIGAYASAVAERYTVDAIVLTLTVAAIVVPLNLLYGVSAAWAVAKFRFAGKTILTTVIDLPLSVSPVISGMLFVLLFGAHGWFGPWLTAHGVKVVFALPGIVLATLFVTAPLVARELIPVLQSQGSDEEEAALTLGASGFRTFWHVSLPKMRWGLLYGTVLCTARAMGEFGAVSVVSGHIRGRTTTLPLQVEILYNEYAFTAAFAVASLLAAVALASLALQTLLGRRERTGP
jgi:sulfate transport system permease protein